MINFEGFTRTSKILVEKEHLEVFGVVSTNPFIFLSSLILPFTNFLGFQMWNIIIGVNPITGPVNNITQTLLLE